VSEDRGDGALILIPPGVSRISSNLYRSMVQDGLKSLTSLLRRTRS
jgi:hypothetical protein